MYLFFSSIFMKMFIGYFLNLKITNSFLIINSDLCEPLQKDAIGGLMYSLVIKNQLYIILPLYNGVFFKFKLNILSR